MPAPEPCHSHPSTLVFPPPSQLPVTCHDGMSTSTEAFYKAMGGPPPSACPLESCALPHRITIPQSVQQVAGQSCHPAKPRILAQFDSDGADDLSTGPNPLSHPLPSVWFDYQHELRDGQAGPSNERLIPKGQGNSKHCDH